MKNKPMIKCPHCENEQLFDPILLEHGEIHLDQCNECKKKFLVACTETEVRIKVKTFILQDAVTYFFTRGWLEGREDSPLEHLKFNLNNSKINYKRR
ncbi:hypothetical protein LCGC14_0395690 [marine sediment metagenome]|uniref:Uncharacterized protein n=1 Tax=marine sediment metagenome TaxID=412755 RepID=A0A0F9W7I7_9ZZZZ